MGDTINETAVICSHLRALNSVVASKAADLMDQLVSRIDGLARERDEALAAEEKVQELHDRFAAQVATAPGWKLVPIKAQAGMASAGALLPRGEILFHQPTRDAERVEVIGFAQACAVYETMVAAAPGHPGTEPKAEGLGCHHGACADEAADEARTPIEGLGRMTDDEDGYVRLQFVTEAAAQRFMNRYKPTVDVRDMPDHVEAADEQTAPDEWAKQQGYAAVTDFRDLPGSDAPTAKVAHMALLYSHGSDEHIRQQALADVGGLDEATKERILHLATITAGVCVSDLTEEGEKLLAFACALRREHDRAERPMASEVEERDEHVVFERHIQNAARVMCDFTPGVQGYRHLFTQRLYDAFLLGGRVSRASQAPREVVAEVVYSRDVDGDSYARAAWVGDIPPNGTKLVAWESGDA